VVNSAAFSPDGKRVITASGDQTARVWDAATGKTLASLQGHTHRVFDAAFSPDGTRVVTASWDHTARVWDAATGKTLASLQGHTSWVNSATFSPDGARVVTASWDQTARVWDAATGKTLASLQGHTDEVNSAAFSPDGARVVTASRDQTARVWLLYPIEGDAGILPTWVEAYTGTEYFQGGAVQVLTAEEWKNRGRQLKAAIQQGSKAPPSKWLDELLAQP
jgi:WD40 repeat protein